MTYKELMNAAFDTLCSNTVKYDKNSCVIAHLLQRNTVLLNVPRAVGKTEFINSVIKNGDLYLSNHLSYNKNLINYKFAITCHRNMPQHDLFRGHRDVIPARFVFLDEVQPTYELLNDLFFRRLIDENTKIFGLQTKV